MAEEEPEFNGITHFPGEVKVAVVNGTGIRGLAGRVAGELNALGYVTVAKNTSNLDMQVSVIYFEPSRKRGARGG